jgi:predicted metal-dependent hydrolase
MPEKPQKPVIVAFISSYSISTRLLDYCEKNGYALELISNFIGLFEPDQQQIPGNNERFLGEPLDGVEGHLLEQLTRLHPVLLIFDINNQKIPWRKWLPVVKSVSATRRMPALCFSNQLDLGLKRELNERGADVSLSSRQFLDNLEDWIEQTASFMDYDSINAACSEPLSVLAIEGLNYFNQGDYFEAHEKLEDAWNEDQSVGRELYRAILQVAVAYLQIERGNYNGAVKMFLRLRQWINPLPKRCRGVNIEQLRATAREVYDRLIASGPDGVSEFDLMLFKPIEFKVVG